jgi:hypothetical protein
MFYLSGSSSCRRDVSFLWQLNWRNLLCASTSTYAERSPSMTGQAFRIVIRQRHPFQHHLTAYTHGNVDTERLTQTVTSTDGHGRGGG